MNSLSYFGIYETTYPPIYVSDPSTSAAGAGAVLAIIGIVYVFTFIFIAIAYVITALLLGRIFKKAGEKAWIAWVPFYNSWKLLELGGQQGFWAVLAIIPGVNIASAVFVCIAMYHIGRKFGKSELFVLWGIFLPIVWYAILALGDAKWQDGQLAVTASTPVVPPAPQV